MRSIVCKMCGGGMALDASGMVAVCPYCGTRYLLDHDDTDYYQDLFKRMNAFFASSKSDQDRKQQAEQLWENAKSRIFIRQDGVPIEIKHMYCYSDKDVDVYVARRNIAFHFPIHGAEKTEQLRKNLSLLDYPSADVRNLDAFFPKLSGGFALEDGSYLCVISKDEDEYPLCLFGSLPGRHVAWIISRLENLCCVLEYNALVHPRINPYTVYINPYTHQASLYGNWWEVARQNTVPVGASTPLQLRDNLLALRETAVRALGYDHQQNVAVTEDVPRALVDFLRSAPRQTAYDDFAFWDDMLIKAYGERKFIRMDVDDESIYGQKG